MQANSVVAIKEYPFFAGRIGIFEMILGDSLVFSRPRDDHNEPKIFFFVRNPDINNIIIQDTSITLHNFHEEDYLIQTNT